VVVAAWSTPAVADDIHLCDQIYEKTWPAAPTAAQVSMGQQLTDAMSELGNQLGYHLDQLSMDKFALRFDGRQRRARFKLGMIDSQYATLKFDSVVHFTDGMAKISAVLDIGIAGHVMHIELPDVEMLPTEYHGERGVQLRLPLYRYYF